MAAVQFTDLVDGIVKLAAVGLAAYALVKLVPAMREHGFTIRIFGGQVTVNGVGEAVDAVSDAVEEQFDRLRADVGVPLPVPSGGGTVLWVDDHPVHNLYEVGKLKEGGLEVTQVKSTTDAQKAMRDGSFDVVITDMERVERGRRNPDAGQQIIDWVHRRTPETPTFVYASAGGVAARGAQMRHATGVTASTIDLLEMIGEATRTASPAPRPADRGSPARRAGRR